MLELTQDGHISASAELVAERANVGLRTVFRHFKDMDSLYREMSLAIEARILEAASMPFVGAAWRERLGELIERRSAIFEIIAPYKRAEAAHRHRSRVLEQDIGRMNDFLRERLRALLPPDVAANGGLFETLDLLLSFEAWERMRRVQALDPDEIRAILGAAVDRLLGVGVAGRETSAD
jgi:AcrR family transcriptional regulator